MRGARRCKGRPGSRLTLPRKILVRFRLYGLFDTFDARKVAARLPYTFARSIIPPATIAIFQNDSPRNVRDDKERGRERERRR